MKVGKKRKGELEREDKHGKRSSSNGITDARCNINSNKCRADRNYHIIILDEKV